MGDETVRMQKVTDEAVTKALAATAAHRTGLGSVLTPERLITGVAALLLGGGVSGVSTNAFNGNEVATAQAAATEAKTERTEMRDRHDEELEHMREEHGAARDAWALRSSQNIDQCREFVARCTDMCRRN